MNPVESYLSQLHSTLQQLSKEQILKAVELLHQARLEQHQIFIMGNGGSASTASHMVCDLSKSTRDQSIPDFRVIGLADNMAIFSAYANDEGYENVFAQQLACFARPGDLVIAISASGKSPNVIKAIELARVLGAYTIGMTGFNGGALASLVDLNLHVPSDCIENVEDIHLILEHLITKALRERARSIITSLEIQEQKIYIQGA